MTRRLTSVRWLAAAVVVGVAATLAVAAPAQALSAGQHTSPQMVDVDKPIWYGWDSAKGAYRIRVFGRWRAVCPTVYCWPGSQYTLGDIGSDDMVGLYFSAAVQVKAIRVISYDACGTLTRDQTVSTSTAGFFDAGAALDDRVYVGKQVTRLSNGQVITSGTCGNSSMPQATYSGGAVVTQWYNMAARSFSLDVWVLPLPAVGNCYDHIWVKGAYNHTWTTQELRWSIGYNGVRFSLGVGIQYTNGNFFAYQSADGYSDPDLQTPQMCR